MHLVVCYILRHNVSLTFKRLFYFTSIVLKDCKYYIRGCKIYYDFFLTYVQ